MTRELNDRFRDFRHACDEAPAGTYEAEKELREAIGDAVDALYSAGRRIAGLNACCSDGAHHVEATIYAWLTKDSSFGATAEGFGMALGTPARDRVIQQAERDRDALARIRGAQS